MSEQPVIQPQQAEQAQRRFVMKCGGSTLAALPRDFYEDLRALQADGVQPVIVHGGGPAISSLLEQLGIPTEFVNGLRKTSNEVLDVVEMVLSGQINKQIVRQLIAAGAKSLGLSGVDGHLLNAAPVANADEVGFVGDVTQVNTAVLEAVLADGWMPVVAPLGLDKEGQRYNINADTAAGAVASALQVERMIVVTDVPGIMRVVDGTKVVLPRVTFSEIEAMIGSGEIYGGMIPKVRAAMACLQGKLEEVVIVDGSTPRVLSRVMAGEQLGTRIAAK